MRLSRPAEFCRPPTALRPHVRAARGVVHASVDRAPMRHRVEQECHAWQQRLDACSRQARAWREAREPTVPAMPPLEALDSMAGVASAQLNIAHSKRQLLLSERDTDIYGPPTFEARAAAMQASLALQKAGLPPIFPQHVPKMRGTWTLMKPTAPHRFGDLELRRLSQGVSQWHPTAPGFVDVQAVVRRITSENTFCESTVFVAAEGLRRGSFSVMGTFEVAHATAVTAFPTVAVLSVDGLTKTFENPPLRPACLKICYLDDDLMLQGRYNAPPDGIAVWGRDHASTYA